MTSQALKKARERKGANLIEVGMGMIAFLMLLLGLMEYGRFIMYRQVVTHAAREGARLAATSTETKSTPDIQDRVTSLLGGLGFSDTPDVQVYQSDSSGKKIGAWNNARFGERIAVRIDGRYPSLLPNLGLLPRTVRLSGLCVMQCEAN